MLLSCCSISVGLDSAADSWLHSLAPAWTFLSVQGHFMSSFILAVPDTWGSSTALCCGGYLASAWPLGSFNGGRKELFSEDPTHFDVQIAQLHEGRFIAAPLMTCNLASANQLLHPVKPSLFPQKAPSQGILAASRLDFCLPVPPSVRISVCKLSGHTLYHLHGIQCPPSLNHHSE